MKKENGNANFAKDTFHLRLTFITIWMFIKGLIRNGVCVVKLFEKISKYFWYETPLPWNEIEFIKIIVHVYHIQYQNLSFQVRIILSILKDLKRVRKCIIVKSVKNNLIKWENWDIMPEKIIIVKITNVIFVGKNLLSLLS